eukprot:m.73993 g.73993  ORF g.73993 m.73993 type:complete len:274 (+) comp24613_c0_seq1:224-1045(+)
MLLLLCSVGLVCAVVVLALVYAWARHHESETMVATVLSKQVLSLALSERHPNTVVSNVRIVRIAKCGDGKASTTDRVTVECDYSEPTLVPRRFIVKLILLPWYYRMGATETTISIAGRIGQALEPIHLDFIVWHAINFYSYYLPHAPDAMYINETRIYRDLYDEFESIEMPKLYGTIYESATCQFGILMEDLTLRHAHFPTACEDSDVSRVESALISLAKLHSMLPPIKHSLRWIAIKKTTCSPRFKMLIQKRNQFGKDEISIDIDSFQHDSK